MDTVFRLVLLLQLCRENFQDFFPLVFCSSCDKVKALYNGLQWTLDKVCAVVACIPGKLYYVLLQGGG